MYNDLNDRINQLEDVVKNINNDIIASVELLDKKPVIVGVEKIHEGYILKLGTGAQDIKIIVGDESNAITPIIGLNAKGNWIVSLDGGQSFKPIEEANGMKEAEGISPKVKIDGEGYWIISLDGEKTWNRLIGENGRPVSAVDGSQIKNTSSFFKDVVVDKEAELVIFLLKDGSEVKVPFKDNFQFKAVSFPDNAIIFLGETQTYDVEMSNIADVIVKVPEGWEAEVTDKAISVTSPLVAEAGKYIITVLAVSPEGFIKSVPFKFFLSDKQIDAEDCKIYKDFIAQNEENILLDYSYAGYNHGETAPAESFGYKVYNVCDYGAIANDGKSDREAFLKCLEAALGVKRRVMKDNEKHKYFVDVTKPVANVVIYFPEGEFILHTKEDDVQSGKAYSVPIQIHASNLIIKGAGRDLTTIYMKDANQPDNPDIMYSSPCMLEIKHNSAPNFATGTTVTEDSPKGSFSIRVASAAGFKEGDWVVLNLKNNDPALVAKELAPYKVESWMTDIMNDGVKVEDMHQIKKVSGNVITFHEPLMHEVEQQWGWQLAQFPHYENVGIEDMTFKGEATDHFEHHKNWAHDGAFKPLAMTRLTNSWLRRVRFTSTSEACSIIKSANCSAYDIIFDGRRGHASVRSAGSSRIFIGATVDRTSGYRIVDNKLTGELIENAGNYHGVGVSKPSMGAVLWRNVWGNDACFESHATQPRATLIDCCRGGWLRWRQGGADNQMPNHLADLTIWNFNSTTPYEGQWVWWDPHSVWWKFVKPIMVGFHGAPCTFDETQMLVNNSQGIPVNPESLYEAQLEARLGSVPAWLLELKYK